MSKRPASAAALPAGQQRLRLDFFYGERKKQATSGGPAGAARGQPYRGDGGSAYTACPVCGVKVPLSLINHHLDSPGQCGGPLLADTGAARAAAAVRAGTPGAAAAWPAAASAAGPAADIAAVSASRAAAARIEAGAPSVCPIGMAVGTKSRCLDSSAVGHSAPRERPRPTEAEAAAAAAAAAPAVAGPAPATLAAADICSVYHYDYNNDDNGIKGAVEGITEIVTSQEEGDVMLVELVSAEGTAVAEAVRAAAAQAAAAQAAAATVAAAQPGRPGGTERMSDVGGARRATTVPDVAVEAGPLASAPGAARAACGGPPESKTGEEMHAAARGTAGAWQPAPHQAPPKDQGQGQGPAAGSGRRTSPLALAQPPTAPQPTNQPPAPPQPPVHAFFQARRHRPPSGSRKGGGGDGGGGGAAGGLGLGADEDPEPRNGVEEEDAGGEAAAGGALCGRQRVPPPLPAGGAPPTMRMVPHPQLQGQALVLDFVSAEEEEALLGLCDTPHPAQPPWLPPAWPRLDQGLQGLHGQSGAQGAEVWGGAHALATVQRSRNKRWGVQPDYHRRGVAPAAHPLPPLLLALARRMRAAVGGPLKDFSPNEANAIDYRRSHGSWLKPHADDRILSGEVIVNLSLAGDCVMTLARLAPQSGSGGGGGGGGGAGAAGGGGADEFRIRLPRRSLQIMSKAARYSYSHGIWPADLLDERRVSITFRHSKPRPFAK